MRSIRARLVGVILLAVLLPAVPLSLVVRNMVERLWNRPLLEETQKGLQAGLIETRATLQNEKLRFMQDVDSLWNPLLTVQWDDIVVLDDSGLVSSEAKPKLGEAIWNISHEEIELIEGWLVTARSSSDGNITIFARNLPTDIVSRATNIMNAIRSVGGARLSLDSGAAFRGYLVSFLLVYSAVTLFAFVAAFIFAERLARPLAALSAAARRVGAGDLEAHVDCGADGEIGDLITEFHQMTASLAAQRRELGRLEKLAAWRGMARILAHEIKNPLTPILLAVQEARRSDPGDHPAHTAMLTDCETIVTEEVEGLRDLVRSFSDFARMPHPEPSVDDFGALLDDLARLYGDRVTVVRPAGPLPRLLDHGQLRRALINLIDNGLAAVRRAGVDAPVALEMDAGPGTDVLRVCDRGDGIPPENLERVFEPDFTTGSQGMGLGLPIVRGIAEGHGGRLDVDSAHGRGTVFTLTLPRREDPS